MAHDGTSGVYNTTLPTLAPHWDLLESLPQFDIDDPAFPAAIVSEG